MLKKYQTIALLGFSGFLYLLFFLIEPLRKKFGDTGIVLRDNRIFILVVLFLIINFLIYLSIINFTNFSKFNFKKIFKSYALFSIILLFIWPVASNDLFSYIYQGRVFFIHQANPYLNTYSQFSYDSFYNLISNRWSFSVSPYGPLFNIIAGVLSWLGKSSLLFSVVLFKSLFLGAHLLTSYLIYKISNLKTFLIYALNPLVIFELIINGHNDAIVILFLVLFLYFLYKENNLKNQLLAWFFLIVSSLIKITTIVFWPVIWIIFLKKHIKDKTITNFVIKTIVLVISAVAISYSPFLERLDIIYKPIINQTTLSGMYSIGIIIIHSLLNIFNYTNISTSIFIGRIIFVFIYLFIILQAFFLKAADHYSHLLKYFYINSNNPLLNLLFLVVALVFYCHYYY